jgi:hypothetical protein
VLGTGEAVDLIRESVRTVLQELIEAEAAEVIGAARYERVIATNPVHEVEAPKPRIEEVTSLPPSSEVTSHCGQPRPGSVTNGADACASGSLDRAGTIVQA